ncbi:8841_t:CDS:2 [Funneliformis geosporum]|nr:8841_t:CDS:2 [Funneliformis geosporum]
MGFFLLLLSVYFYLSGKLVQWLVRIEIPANQQEPIFQNKIYLADEKTHYAVEKITNLEISSYANSASATVQGTLSLLLKKPTKISKQIAFILHTPKQSLDYLTTRKQFPDTAIGDVLSGENEKRKQQARAEEEQRKSAEERKKYIVESADIGTTWSQIGAQAVAKASGSFFAYASGGQFAGKDRQAREERINLFLNGVVKESQGQPCILFIDEFDRMSDEGKKDKSATNKAEQIDLALFRSERFGKKILITFPEKKELKDIIRVTLGMFYDETQPHEPNLFTKNRELFVKEFTEAIFKEISENKEYEINPNELVGGERFNHETRKMEKVKVFDEEEVPPRPLFVGADIKKIICKEAPAIAFSRGRKAINMEDFKKAIKHTYEYNRSQGLQQEEMRKFLTEMLRIKGKDKKQGLYY